MPQNLYLKIGAAIRDRRINVGMTQEALAQRAGVSRTTVTNIERGGQGLLVHQLLALAEALRINPMQLVPSRSSSDSEPVTEPVNEEVKALLDRLVDTKPRARSR